MNRPTILDNENVALLDLTPSGREKPAWAFAAEREVGRQMASLNASVMRRAGDDDTTAWDDVRKYVEGLEAKNDEAFINGMAHGQAAMPSGTFVTIDSEEMVIMRARIAELEKRLATAERVISRQRDALQPLSGSVFNDNGDITVNLSMPTGEEFIAAYCADRAARAYMEGK